MHVRVYFICFLLLSTPTFSQINLQQSNPTAALENFDFVSIDHATLNPVASDYIKAIEHSLYQRFDEAERLMKKVALCSDASMSEVARFYLLNELYFWRGKYAEYVEFADQIKKKDGLYELAKKLTVQPPATIRFSTDSSAVSITIHKRSYVIVNVTLNGKPARLMLDSGASQTVISQQLKDELKLMTLANTTLTNSLGIQVRSSVSMLDSIAVGNITLYNMPVIHTAKSKLFKRMHIDGLLGWDALRQLNYTTDFKAQTLLIRKPIIDSTAEKNLFGISAPFVTVHTPAARQLNLFFDSGSNSIDLTQKGTTKLGIYKLGRRPGAISGIGKTKIGFLRHVKNFTFMTSGRTLTQKRTYLTPIEWTILNIKCDGVLSNALFQKGRLTVDYVNNHFHYEAN